MAKDKFKSEYSAWLGDSRSEIQKDELAHALDVLYQAGPDPARISKVQAAVRISISEVEARSLFYDVLMDTPVGPIYIASDDKGVVAIKINLSEPEFVSNLEKQYGTDVIYSPPRAKKVIDQLRDYFEGGRASFSLELNLGDLTQFQQRVLQATLEVPRGQITTYGEIARRLGEARLARAVGQALARNPIPILIPCHRVLGADGSLHGYSGGKGLETKGKLLKLEGVFVA